MPGIYRLQAHEYVHVEDGNTGAVYTLLGPLTFTLLDHMTPLHAEPQPCVVVPPHCYVTIHNPVHRSGGNDLNSTAGFQLISGATAEEKSSSDTTDGSSSSSAVQRDPPLLTHPAVAFCQYGAVAYRFHVSDDPEVPSSPFPLFPGETAEAPRPMTLLQSDEAVLLYVEEELELPAAGKSTSSAPKLVYYPGEYRIFTGPGVYKPDTRECLKGPIQPLILEGSEALWLRARQAFTEEELVVSGGSVSPDGDVVRTLRRTPRVAGEEWTRTAPGLYFPHPYLEVVRRLPPVVLSPSEAVLLEARCAFTDDRLNSSSPVQRVPGERWLLTYSEIQAITLTHNEKVVERVPLTVVDARQYCKVKNPYRHGRNEWGVIELRKGPCSFFIYPGEVLVDNTVWDAYVCAADEALLVQAQTAFLDDTANVDREPSQRWLVRGPCGYIPSLNVTVLEWRKVIPLSIHQGVYVQNMVTGHIRSVFGTPFMLSAEEMLWEKPVSDLVKRLLHRPWRNAPSQDKSQLSNTSKEGGSVCSSREGRMTVRPKRYEGHLSVPVLDLQRFEVLTANVEENNFVRLYNASDGTSRVVAGPCTVYLSPHEEFTVMSLSGGRPKKPDQIQSLRLFLGPDYMADIILVETLDHTRLQLALAYNWEFDTSDMNVTMQKAFAIPDFVGEACRALASRVRAVIAGVTFENFHMNSTRLIRQAIFCQSGDGSLQVRREGQLYFTANGLVITNVDVQQVQPADDRTLHALKKSVQLAVEIITKSQENEATHQAALLEQEAAGALELQSMTDQSSTESQRLQLLEVESRNAEIELIGASTAHAVARRESRLVEVEAAVEASPVRCEAYDVAQEAELKLLEQRIQGDLKHQKQRHLIELEKKKALAKIEAEKYEQIMQALGQETLVALAEAGPELQCQLLQAMGLQGFLITDGKSPLHLFDMASQMASTRENGSKTAA